MKAKRVTAKILAALLLVKFCGASAFAELSLTEVSYGYSSDASESSETAQENEMSPKGFHFELPESFGEQPDTIKNEPNDLKNEKGDSEDDFLQNIVIEWEAENIGTDISSEEFVSSEFQAIQSDFSTNETQFGAQVQPTMIPGASLKLETDGTVSLRFRASMAAAGRVIVSEYGFLIARTSVLESLNRELDFELPSSKYIKGVAYSVEDGIDNIYKTDEDGNFLFLLVCLNIPFNNYVDYLTVRPYAIYKNNDVETILYGEPYSDSIYRTAKRGIQIEYSDIFQTVIDMIEQNTALLNNATAISLYNTVQRNTQSNPDIDLLKFIPQSSRYYAFDLSSEENLFYEVTDPNGNILGSTTVNGYNCYSLIESNTYYIRIRGERDSAYTAAIMDMSGKNIGAYTTISLFKNDVTIPVGYIQAGKVLVVSAIPTQGGMALDYIESIGLNPAPGVFSGGWYPGSVMSYYKITNNNTYTLNVRPKNDSESKDATSITIYMYTVDYIDGFQKYDPLEEVSGAYNYVISNLPEHLGKRTDLLKSENWNFVDEDGDFKKTIMVDGSERVLPLKASVKLVKKKKNEVVQFTNFILNSEMKEVVDKLKNQEKLSVTEADKYYKYIKANNLEVTTTLSADMINQLGEYGYYLHKSKINGNANVHWEHINSYGSDMYYGILLQNTGSTNLTVELIKRSYDSTFESGPSSLTSIWSDYFKRIRYDSADISGLSSSITIPPSSARWVALYKVANGGGYNIFNGLLSLSITTEAGSVYTGSSLYCYSFIMTDWINNAGLTMYQTVQNNIGNVEFTRAWGASLDETNLHISGTGNGASLLKSKDAMIDITGDRYSFLLTGFDAPYLNSGELIPLYHDGPPFGGESGYLIPNSQNYGVIYKLSFSGFNTTTANEQIKLHLKFNRLTNPGAVSSQLAGVFATVYCPTLSNTPYTYFLSRPEDGGVSEAIYPHNIPSRLAFDMYIVVGSMSSMPLEVQFVAE